MPAVVSPMDFDPSAGSGDVLGLYSALSVHHYNRGILKSRCLKCSSRNEYRLTEPESSERTIFIAVETSSCCHRLFCCRQRPYQIDIVSGDLSTGAPVISMKRQWKCCFFPLKPCYRESVTITNSTGKKLGTVQEGLWCCVPEFFILRANEYKLFRIHQPTCCGGVCVNCCRDGCSTISPYYIYDPTESKVEGKLVPEVLRTSNVYSVDGTGGRVAEIQFPPNADASEKAVVLAAYFLINVMFLDWAYL